MSGHPRGAILSHRNLLANARATRQAAALSSDDHVLAALPFAHLFGLIVTGAAPLLAGARVTTMERFHPARALELIAESGITQLAGVPALFRSLVTVLERRGGRFTDHRLRVCICGGAPLPVALQDRFAELTGVELRQGYGLTEAGPVALFNRVELPNRRGNLGVPLAGVEVCIRDPDGGAAMPAGTEGELCVRGESVFTGYQGGARDGLVVRDGWLHTGDRGCALPDGGFAFTGVAKRMFTRNGYNVYPAELERVIGEMPGVAAVRVYGVPDPASEHDIGVDVACTRDAVGALVTESDVRAWCAARLGAYKQPALVQLR